MDVGDHHMAIETQAWWHMPNQSTWQWGRDNQELKSVFCCMQIPGQLELQNKTAFILSSSWFVC